MMRVDAWHLTVAPVDMRCGMDSLLSRVITIFGAAQPHTAYAFANQRASRMKVLIHDGFGLWLCTQTTTPRQPALAHRRASKNQLERPATAGTHGGFALAQNRS